MKCWTILALLVVAVVLGVGHAEETADDFEETALEKTKNDVQLADSFMNPENDDDDDDDDETENALESVNETPSNDEDEPEMFKRAPLWGRRRRRRRRRRFWRRIKNGFKKFGKKIRNGLRRVLCGWLKNVKHKIVGHACRLISGDEEYPRVSDDETFITAQEAHELVKQGWLQRDE